MTDTVHTKRSLAAECMSNDMAFPALDTNYTPNSTIQLGLTKREYFAALALQGLYASNGLPAPSDIDPADDRGLRARERRADEAVRAADALIAALTDDPRSQS